MGIKQSDSNAAMMIALKMPEREDISPDSVRPMMVKSAIAQAIPQMILRAKRTVHTVGFARSLDVNARISRRRVFAI